MDLTKNIISDSSTPLIIDKGIMCFNFNDINFVYNFPTMFIKNRKEDNEKESVGVWKIKQLKQ